MLKTMCRVFLISIFYVTLSAANCAAVSLRIDPVTNQLLGADRVKVWDYGFFDVSFVDGTAYDLFDGCNGWSFDWLSNGQAGMAARALMYDVFQAQGNEVYDDNPALTSGITAKNWGFIYIPTHFDSLNPFELEGYYFVNTNDTFDNDRFGTFAWPDANKNYDSTVKENSTFAIWSPSAVPVPSAIWLFGTGLLSLARIYRRKEY